MKQPHLGNITITTREQFISPLEKTMQRALKNIRRAQDGAQSVRDSGVFGNPGKQG